MLQRAERSVDRKTLLSIPAHSGFVRGLTTANDGNSFFSCGDDRTIKRWPIKLDSEEKYAQDVEVHLLSDLNLKTNTCIYLQANEHVPWRIRI
jgi:WD40 repeat protein